MFKRRKQHDIWAVWLGTGDDADKLAALCSTEDEASALLDQALDQYDDIANEWHNCELVGAAAPLRPGDQRTVHIYLTAHTDEDGDEITDLHVFADRPTAQFAMSQLGVDARIQEVPINRWLVEPAELMGTKS
jgi:hypothetical protein